MFVVLRIVLFVGAIFWLSPFRPGLEAELKPVPNPRLEAALKADPDGIGRLIDALTALPSERLRKPQETSA